MLQPLLGRRRDLDVMPFVGEGLAKRPADARLVIDNQDAAHGSPFGMPFTLGKVETKPRRRRPSVQESCPPCSAATW